MNFDGSTPNNPRSLDHVHGTEYELLQMIKEGEHQKQDFKFRIDSSLKIAKTLCAFANTDGGKLLIGVKDNGRIAGIDPEEEFYMMDGAATVYCKPHINFQAKVYSAENKLVLEIDVPPSKNRPHFAKDEDQKWTAFVRQHDENFMANRVLLSYLRDKTPKSEKKNLIAYGPQERLLFEYLSENENISLSKFSKISKIPLHEAEKTLALFLKWGIVKWKAYEAGIRFSLV